MVKKFSNMIYYNDFDRDFYNINLKEYLPDKIIDFHTHVYKKEFNRTSRDLKRTVSWTEMVADENPVEHLNMTYQTLFADKKVIPLIFSGIIDEEMCGNANQYITACSKKYNYPSLLWSFPSLSGMELINKINEGNFLGVKSYLTCAPSHIPADKINIFDFFPHHQLKVLNDNKKIVMLHIPGAKRLKDPVNLAQLIEIEKKYPKIKLVVAHVGRAYCKDDVGDSFNILKHTKNMMFDISANCNDWVFEQLINTFGPKRILFGSDLPILRMKCKRICENGKYINIVPKGIYGDVSADSHMREAEKKQAEQITYFLYEEIMAFKKASIKTGLIKQDIEDVFYNNAYKIIQEVIK